MRRDGGGARKARERLQLLNERRNARVPAPGRAGALPQAREPLRDVLQMPPVAALGAPHVRPANDVAAHGAPEHLVRARGARPRGAGGFRERLAAPAAPHGQARREVVRVSGTASLARDPDLLAEMTVNGKVPDLAMIVRVREAFFHCGKSMIRSGLWEPDRWGPIDGLPSYAQALKDHGALDVSLDALQRGLERNETERLY